MNDNDLVKMGSLIVVCYSVYMICHVAQGTLAPNGLILSAVIGAICVLAGVKYERIRKESVSPSSEITTADPE